MVERIQDVTLVPKRVRLVVFDLDGTLADTFEDIAQATNRALKAFGCPTYDTATIKGFVGRGVRNLMIQALGPEKEAFADAAVVMWREYYEKHPIDYTRLYPGAADMLEWLRGRNVRTAIVSNKVDSLTQQIATAMGLAARVDFVRGESPEFPRKPDPAILQHLLSLYGVRAEETIIVGDGAPDLELAGQAGAVFCGVLTGNLTREDFRALGAKWVVETIDVLRAQLEASGACDGENAMQRTMNDG